jgi:signal transduction histidine kinase
MLAVTAIAVILFGVPLGYAASRFYKSREVTLLQREAARATGALPPTGLHGRDPVDLPTPPDGVSLAMYDKHLRRVAGTGPEHGSRAIVDALRGQTTDARQGDDLVVAVPVHDEEAIVGAAWASRPWSDVESRIHRAWLAMGAVGLAAIGMAALAAFAEARLLASPVLALTDAADRLGEGDFTVEVERSGVAELDQAAAALEATASRLDELLQRERTFAADASHQLSTPLTSLRYTLEAALLDPAPNDHRALSDALVEVDRLQTTIQTLLAAKRDDMPRSSTDVREVVSDVVSEWRPRLASRSRELRTELPPDLPVSGANPDVLGQVLRVLVENAHDHGSGTVMIRARRAGAGLIVEVEDEGAGIPAGMGDVFERRSSSARGHGIGLSLARSLAAAEGGRLLLQRARPRPVFLLALPPAP